MDDAELFLGSNRVVDQATRGSLGGAERWRSQPIKSKLDCYAARCVLLLLYLRYLVGVDFGEPTTTVQDTQTPRIEEDACSADTYLTEVVYRQSIEQT
jgi:hypothetical protein